MLEFLGDSVFVEVFDAMRKLFYCHLHCITFSFFFFLLTLNLKSGTRTRKISTGYPVTKTGSVVTHYSLYHFDAILKLDNYDLEGFEAFGFLLAAVLSVFLVVITSTNTADVDGVAVFILHIIIITTICNSSMVLNRYFYLDYIITVRCIARVDRIALGGPSIARRLQ